MKKLSSIMFLGTGSDVGKSVITAAFCRIFLQDGYQPAPFKAQNMSNNSYITLDGLEMSRAQVVQAEAAGIDSHIDMNPLMLKPSSDKVCDVILNGRSIGQQDAYTYFKNDGREFLKREVHNSFDRLATRFNPIVMEGAGSISEINLRDTDLVNMPMAIYAKAPVILIADIERGGVFASLYGSVMLLTEEERKHLKGIIINKFRGDLRLFDSGITMIEELCGVPILGVIPYFNEIDIEEEDSLQLAKKSQTATAITGKVNVVVILMKHLSHFTDFDLLAKDPRIHLYYSNQPDEIKKADIAFIPNSQSPFETLETFRHQKIDDAIVDLFQRGKTVIGIGTGYYLMGKTITDNKQVTLAGLNILPIKSALQEDITSSQVAGKLIANNTTFEGYLIESATVSCQKPSPLVIINNKEEGYLLNERCFGTSIHGLLHNHSIIDFILHHYTKEKVEKIDLKATKDQQYDKLALHVRQYIDLDKTYQIMREGI